MKCGKNFQLCSDRASLVPVNDFSSQSGFVYAARTDQKLRSLCCLYAHGVPFLRLERYESVGVTMQFCLTGIEVKPFTKVASQNKLDPPIRNAFTQVI